jgi:hypothetical protein
MADLTFPWDAYMQAVQQKNRNRMLIPEAVGQGLATAGQTAGDYFKYKAAQKQKAQQQAAMKQLVGLFGQPQGPVDATGAGPTAAPPNPGQVATLGSQAFGNQAGAILPLLMKMMPQSKQGTVSLWRNTKTGAGSLTPQTGPDWIEEKNLTPVQREGQFSQSIGALARKTWGDTLSDRQALLTASNLYNALNSLDKSSGGILGQAAQIQWRSQRGEEFLNTPTITPDSRVYQLVNADLASIAQGGSPTIAAQAEATMPNIRQNANALLQKITANPKEVNTPAVRQQLRAIFQAMGTSAGSIINQNTQGVRAIYHKWIEKDPDAFNQAVYWIGSGIKPPDLSKLPPLPNAPGGDTNINTGGSNDGWGPVEIAQ